MAHPWPGQGRRGELIWGLTARGWRGIDLAGKRGEGIVRVVVSDEGGEGEESSLGRADVLVRGLG